LLGKIVVVEYQTI